MSNPPYYLVIVITVVLHEGYKTQLVARAIFLLLSSRFAANYVELLIHTESVTA